MLRIADFTVEVNLARAIAKKIALACFRNLTVISFSPSNNAIFIEVNRNIPIGILIDKELLYFCRINHIHVVIFSDRGNILRESIIAL